MGWITDSWFHVRFNSISDITERWEGDNERLFVLEPRLPMKGFLRSMGIELRTGRSADQRCIHREPDSHEIHVVLKRSSLPCLVDVSKPKSQH